MSSPDNLLYTLHIALEPNLVDIIETALELLGVPFSRWKDSDTGKLRIDVFLDSEDSLNKLAESLEKQLSEFAPKKSWKITRESIQNKNWQDAWKDFFHVEHVSDRIVIRPSHEEYTPSPSECVIDIDPGMSFGTGQHATTRGCLHFLDKISATNSGLSFLDLGCGSGILSIAAAKLGFRKITALDIDPDSVRIARENADANGVADLIDFDIADVSQLNLSEKYDAVAANILARVLLPNAQIISSAVRSGGYLMLAGILTEQYTQVRNTYCDLGWTETDKITEKEWTSILLR
jgi:ribosomal protein L11 methyltransferase